MASRSHRKTECSGCKPTTGPEKIKLPKYVSTAIEITSETSDAAFLIFANLRCVKLVGEYEKCRWLQVDLSRGRAVGHASTPGLVQKSDLRYIAQIGGLDARDWATK